MIDEESEIVEIPEFIKKRRSKKWETARRIVASVMPAMIILAMFSIIYLAVNQLQSEYSFKSPETVLSEVRSFSMKYGFIPSQLEEVYKNKPVPVYKRGKRYSYKKIVINGRIYGVIFISSEIYGNEASMQDILKAINSGKDIVRIKSAIYCIVSIPNSKQGQTINQ